jgi:hypothetical protein
MNVLSRNGFGPGIYGRFGNGRAEQWLNAHALRPDDLVRPDLTPKIAAAVAALHAMDIHTESDRKIPRTPGMTHPFTRSAPSTRSSLSLYWPIASPLLSPLLWPPPPPRCAALFDTIDEWGALALGVRFDPAKDPKAAEKNAALDKLNLKARPPASTRPHSTLWLCVCMICMYVQNILREVESLRHQLLSSSSASADRLVFCHNDLLSGNILVEEQKHSGGPHTTANSNANANS